MPDSTKPQLDARSSDRSPAPETRDGNLQRYEAPRLVALGSVRDLTLGTSGKTRDVITRTKKP